MPSTFALRRGLDEFHLCRKLEDCQGEGAGAPKPHPFYENISALVFLRSCINDPVQERNLRLWLDAGTPFSATSSDDPGEEGDVLAHVAKMLLAGQLMLAAIAREGEGEAKGIIRAGEGSGSARRAQKREATPLQHEMARRAEAAAEEEVIDLGEPEPERTWIEIELVDENSNPVRNERYKLTLPDGSVKWGRLDSHGKARVERLLPGSCQVTFPDRDEEVWDVG